MAGLLPPMPGSPAVERKIASDFHPEVLKPFGTVASIRTSRMSHGRRKRWAGCPKIKAPLMIHYAGLDDRINAGWPAFETALKANGTSYEMFMYPNVNHGFHNDTTPRYDETAAKLAWSRTVAFLDKNLR